MTIITISLASAVVALILTFLFKRTRSQEEGKNLPPGSYGWTFLGESLDFVRSRWSGSPETFTRDRIKKYKSQIFKTWLLGEPVVMVCGPAATKFLFSNEGKSVAAWWPDSVKERVGKTISTTRGAETRNMRKMVSGFMNPVAFTKFYMSTINIVSEQHFNTHWEGKDELKVLPTIKLRTFEMACRLFCSIEDPKKIKELATHFNLFRGVYSWMPFDIPGTKYYKAKRAAPAIKKQLRAIVEQRRDLLEQKGSVGTPQDLLSHLLVCPDENGKLMSESVIVDNIVLLLFAGTDSTTSSITMLMKILAEHPEVYQNVLKEQREISSSKKPGEFLEWEDIQKMKYSWNVVCETMRIWPPTGAITRELLTDINFGGYDIPKGWKLILDVAAIHRESDLFPDSMKFDPTRFDGAGPAPFSFVPFGGGPRTCVGKEFARLQILTFLNNVITKFKWELLIPEEKIVYDSFPTPQNGLPIRLHQHM